MESALRVDSGKLVFKTPDTGSLNVLDLGTWAVTDLGVTLYFSQYVVEGGLLRYVGEEDAVDWNGDGDLDDRTVWIHDLVNGGQHHVGVATFGPGSLNLSTSQLLFLQDESDQGATDLNGDGDATDRVWTLYDLESGLLQGLGLAGTHSIGGPSVSPGSAFGDFVVVSIYEQAQGEDLNGSGSLNEVVAVVAPADGYRRWRVLDIVLYLYNPFALEGVGVVAPATIDFARRPAVFEDCP